MAATVFPRPTGRASVEQGSPLPAALVPDSHRQTLRNVARHSRIDRRGLLGVFSTRNPSTTLVA